MKALFSVYIRLVGVVVLVKALQITFAFVVSDSQPVFLRFRKLYLLVGKLFDIVGKILPGTSISPSSIISAFILRSTETPNPLRKE